MDGLECSEILLSCLNKEMRIDSEYFKKKYLQDDLYMSINSATPIECFVTDGQHGYHEIDESSTIHMLSAKNAMDWFADITGALPVAKWVDDNNKRSSLHSGDLVLTTRGSVGHCAIVESDILPANLDQDLARIEILDSQFCSEYVLTYLNSKYGQDWMIRNQSGMIQQGLPLQKVRELPIPHLSLNLQKQIAFTIQQASKSRAVGKHSYSTAQLLLLSTLNYHPITQADNHTAKSFSSSFAKTGRLDAEYYQPKYDEYSRLVRTFTNGWARISEVFTQIKTKCTRDSQSYRYVEIGDIDVSSGTATPNDIDTCDLPDNAKIITLSGDILVSTVRPNRGAVAILEEDDLLVSGAFTVLRQKAGYPKEVLQVLLRTPLYKDWLLQTNVGTSYPVIKDGDVLNFPIPVFSDEINLSVLKKIQESSTLRRKSQQLLENAKCAVEMAIEQGEDKAIRWLQEQSEI